MTDRAFRSRHRYVVEIGGHFHEAPPKPMRLADVAKERGMSPSVVLDRVKRGWDVHRALTVPKQAKQQRVRTW